MKFELFINTFLITLGVVYLGCIIAEIWIYITDKYKKYRAKDE